jgi:hypothetical protein
MAGTAAAGWHHSDSYGGRSLGHYGAKALIGSIVALVALTIVPLPPDNPVTYVLPVLLFGFVLGSWVLMRQHDRGLCELCLHTMPLDAAAQAQKHHRRLALVHAGQDRRLMAAYLVVLLGSNGLLFIDALWARVVWGVVQLSMIQLVLAYSTHRSLQPWCPWCSEGGGGDEVVDTPEPMPVGGSKVS